MRVTLALLARRHSMWTCRELAERATDYLDGAMPPAEMSAFERHVALCVHCAAFLRQLRLVVAMLERIHDVR